MDFDFTTETITPDSTNVLTIGGSGGLELSVGTTAQRPVSPINGTLRYNTDLNRIEGFSNSSWVSTVNVGTITSLDVSGGTTGLTTSGGPVTSSGTITLTGTLITANGGTGLTAIGTALQVLRVNAGGTGLEYATAGTGTVTSVAATQPAAGLTITGSPITTSGTLTFALANDLAAVEGLATTGIATRTAADTWTTRTITGTTNRITLTNGNGVAGNPTIDIAATYVGQTSITTLGTIGTGTWQGTAVGATFGGTGQTTYAVGDILYANTTTTLAKLADVATGNSLISGGVGVAPSWGKIGLATHVSGILPIANGGTNLSTTPTNGQLLIGNGTGYTLATLVQPAAGLTITNGAGSITFALANDLLAVENLATNGIAVRTGTSTWATRTITGTTNTIAVTNGDGVAGNPTITIADNPILPGTAGMVLNSGTTAQRPVSPTNGTIRYNTTLGVTEMYQNGMWFTVNGTTSGNQGIINIYTGAIPAASGTSAVPWDNTTPLSTEGSEIWTFTLTPTLAVSSFKLTVPFTADCGSSNRIVISSIFRGSVNIGSALFFATGGGRPTTTTLSVTDTPGVLTPVTYSMRTGVGAGSATWYINSTSSGNDLGGALVSAWQITEVA